MLRPAPTENAVSVRPGSSDTIRLGCASTVTLRPWPSCAVRGNDGSAPTGSDLKPHAGAATASAASGRARRRRRELIFEPILDSAHAEEGQPVLGERRLAGRRDARLRPRRAGAPIDRAGRAGRLPDTSSGGLAFRRRRPPPGRLGPGGVARAGRGARGAGVLRDDGAARAGRPPLRTGPACAARRRERRGDGEGTVSVESVGARPPGGAGAERGAHPPRHGGAGPRRGGGRGDPPPEFGARGPPP